jgi:asparagine synthase (glutamine-hydrolysing)
MKGFFGILGTDAGSIETFVQEFKKNVGKGLPKPIVENEGFFLIDLNTQRPKNLEALFPNLSYAGWVRLDNRNELLPKLGLSEEHSDEVCILTAYQKYGEKCTEHFIGDFSLVIWNKEKKQLFLAKDQVGIRPLFYLQTNGVLIFSSSIPLIKNALTFKPALNEVYIAKQLKNYTVNVEETFFKDIHRLKPAHYILTNGSKVLEKRYWELQAIDLPKFKNKEDYFQLLRISMEEAIRCRIRGKKTIGSQLSGGMDSSAITVILSRIMDKKHLHTYSFVLDKESIEYSKTKIDEQDTQKEIIRYAALLEENHHPITRFHYKDIFEELRSRNTVMGGLADSDSFWQDSLYKYAGENQGVEIMFSGFPGDEGISEYGNLYYYDYLHEKNIWGILSYILEFRLGGLRNIRRYYRYKKKGTFFPGYASIQQGRDILHPNSKFHQTLLDDSFPFYSSYKEYLKNHSLRQHSALRSESEGAYAIQYGVETVYPLADIRLIQLVYSLPIHLFKPKPYTRALFRNVCQGILPDKVRLQYKYNYAYTLAFYDFYAKKKIEALKDYQVQNVLGLLRDTEDYLNAPNKHGEDKEDRLTVMKEIDYLICLNLPS